MVEPNPAKERYRRFVDDYQRGVERAELCARYDIPAAKFDEFVAFLRRQGFRLAPPIPTGFARAHEIDFAISGDDMQYVEVELDPRETAIAEAGAMLYIEPGIEMETIFGDGSRESEGVMARIFGAGKRILIGESLFMTAFTNGGARKQRVAFSAP
ncbi:MAG: AIM24 family protein, partial [Nitrospirota bacterium]